MNTAAQTAPTYPAHYLSVTSDPATLALMSEFDRLVDALYAAPSTDNAAQVAACEAFNAANPTIRPLVWTAEEPA